jgi:hypothetical protein
MQKQTVAMSPVIDRRCTLIFKNVDDSTKIISKFGIKTLRSNIMAEKTGKTSKISKTSEIKPKRLSKGQRTHVRRLKQEANKPSPVHN